MAEAGTAALPSGSALREYVIDKVLGQGGFGITYLAQDRLLEAPVAIKEYFPGQWAARSGAAVGVRPDERENFGWGLARFLDEARVLARFRHPAIVQVLRYFEDNGTAYMVMQFEDGDSFGAYLKQLGRPPAEAELLALLDPLLDGLAVVHKAQFLHRDIKPDNILLRREGGGPVLLDFGAARQASGERTMNLTRVVSRGYTPPEQAVGGNAQGPWSDLFALAGVAYQALTGQAPMDATHRAMAPQLGLDDTMTPARELGAGRYSEAFLAAIDWALLIDPRQRPRDVGQWRAALHGQAAAPLTAGATAGAATGAAPPPPPRLTGEEDFWQAAIDRGNADSYRLYLEIHPKGAHAAEARATLDRLDETEAWMHAQARAEGADFEHYLERFPAGPHAAEARAALAVHTETAAWRQAEAGASYESYQAYLARHPDGRHAAEARAAAATLVDERAWTLVKALDKLPAYQDYLTDHPDGRHAAEAHAILARAREEAAWAEAARKGDRAALAAFIEAHPDGRNAPAARAALARMEELDRSSRVQSDQQHWDQAQAQDDARAYRAYLGFHPDGEHVAAAQARLAELDLADRERRQEAADWRQTQTAKTLAAYEGYLANHPTGTHAEEARTAATAITEALERRGNDARDWAQAATTGTLPAYQAYVDFHPDGVHAADARRAIEQLHEDERQRMADDGAWIRACQAATRDSYEDYLDSWPDGAHADQAWAAITALREEKLRHRAETDEPDWRDAVRSDSEDFYRRYLDDHPDGAHAEAARAALARIADEVRGERRQVDAQEWRAAEAGGTLAHYRAYLAMFPDGIAAEAARIQVDRLEEIECRRREAEAARDWAALGPGAPQEALRQFIQRHPGAAQIEEARARLKHDEEVAQQPRILFASPATLGVCAAAAAAILALVQLVARDVLHLATPLGMAAAVIAAFALVLAYLLASREVPPHAALISSAATTAGAALVMLLLLGFRR